MDREDAAALWEAAQEAGAGAVELDRLAAAAERRLRELLNSEAPF